MKTQTSQKILEYLAKNKQVKPVQLIEELNITRAALHRQLNKLLNKGLITKIGQAPVVFYSLKTEVKNDELDKIVSQLDDELKHFLDQNYLYFSPQGDLLSGLEGFYAWFKNNSQNSSLLSLAKQYFKVRTQFSLASNLIDATDKLASTFDQLFIDKLFYQDFYSLPQFGKTKLGLLVLHAKQSQNRTLIKQIAKLIKPQIEKILDRYQIQAVAFIPPSLPREVQFLKELEQNLSLSLPKVKLVKVYTGEIIVAQKSLSKLNERVINAEKTIQVNQASIPFQRVLLLDDAVGSGATFNQVAEKLKQNFRVKKVYAFAPVGSLKGFPVISEV